MLKKSNHPTVKLALLFSVAGLSSLVLISCASIFSTKSVLTNLPNPEPAFGSGEKTAKRSRLSTAELTPKPVADVDFWARDRMHLPTLPTRNMLPNPSFEQGLRYWTWRITGGGTDYKEGYDKLPQRYELSDDTKFGHNALRLNDSRNDIEITSLPIPVIKDKTYTTSFYAKAVKGKNGLLKYGKIPACLKDGERLWHQQALGAEWQRLCFSFKATEPAAHIAFKGINALVDGMQVEEGDKASEFIMPAVEGRLITSEPDNILDKSEELDARFVLSGKPDLKGKVKLDIFDYYRENKFSKAYDFHLDKDGIMSIALPLTGIDLGTGVFAIRAEYLPSSGNGYFDFYRLGIYNYLRNEHPTKNIFGHVAIFHRCTRADDLARLFMRWGFGSVHKARECYHVSPEFLKKYNISNSVNEITSWPPRQVKDLSGNFHDVKYYEEFLHNTAKATPEKLKELQESIAQDIAKQPNWGLNLISFSGEEECRSPMWKGKDYDECVKMLMAVREAVKRARPSAQVLASSGTSGFNPLRGYEETEGIMKASQGKVRWDGWATHPYGVVDDLDRDLTYMVKLMEKYGYGKDTPIYLPEFFNAINVNIPEWGADACLDLYQGGKPSYDFGHQEMLCAAHVSRTYLACLKFHPQLKIATLWMWPAFIDLNFAPMLYTAAVNTLGNLCGDVKFVSDVKPYEGVTGYVFEDAKGRGLAAVWFNSQTTEDGLERGPVLKVNFSADIPEFIDLMGNIREVASQHGAVAIPLSPAPLFLRGGDPKALATALNDAELLGAASGLVNVRVLPAKGGALEAVIRNCTNKTQAGEIVANEKRHSFTLKASESTSLQLEKSGKVEPGRIYEWRKAIDVKLPGGESKVKCDLNYFFVPQTAKPLPLTPSAPEWKTVPSISLTNRICFLDRTANKKAEDNGQDDQQARIQMAWDKNNLYVRVEGQDDEFITNTPKWLELPEVKRNEALYLNDGCVELYFDTGANGLYNAKRGYDLDDYRYDFYAGDASAQTGPGLVYRLKEPFHQLAGGTDMPTKTEAAKGVICFFERTGKNSYAYVMIFAQRYIEPLALRSGFRSGFCVFIHDKDGARGLKGLTLSSESGKHCNMRPDLWPIMVLDE